MLNYQEEYDKWMKYDKLDSSLRGELSLACNDENLKKDMFYTDLSFGTAGLRGIMGAGRNRMNVYTVAVATQALADTILTAGAIFARKGVCICYDCRRKSYDFALLAAEIMAANGVPVRMFSDMRPTPQLSFAILHYGCAAGLNITASHNPQEYNGYKVYWQDGAQISTQQAELIGKRIADIAIFDGAKRMDFEEAKAAGLITFIESTDDEIYLNAILKSEIDSEAVLEQAGRLGIVYTPFHGVGGRIMPRLFEKLGYENVTYVSEQMEPDGGFPTVKSPNPEERQSFKLAIDYGHKSGADVIVATDPDADRVGIMARNGLGEYEFLTGNQTGALLLDYMIYALGKTGKMPRKPAFVTTIVTGSMAKHIARRNEIKCFETFTGFKNMAQEVAAISKQGYKYILAFEESYGYMTGDYARDKDGLAATMLLLEMACHYKKQNITLPQALDNLYHKYGGFAETAISIIMTGERGRAQMGDIMAALRKIPPKQIGGVKVESIADYLSGDKLWLVTGYAEKMPLRGSNVLEMALEDGTRCIVRPSGTEPKMKVYILATGKNRALAQARAHSCCEEIRQSILFAK